MLVEADAIVRDYLGRLEAAAWPLAADRRVELAGEVRQHIETALAEAGRRDEVTVRNVLDRLGAPEEIVAAELESPGAEARSWPPRAAGSPSRSAAFGGVEIAALLLLTVGAVLLPFIGPLIGLVFVWLSTQWETRHKVIATGIVVVLVVMPVLGVLSARSF
jgi:hypothetical protein